MAANDSSPDVSNPEDDFRERQQMIDTIMEELWRGFPLKQARKLAKENRSYITFETILATAWRRTKKGLKRLTEDDLRRFSEEIRLAMGYLKKTMWNAVLETVRKRRRDDGNFGDHCPEEPEEPEEDLDRFLSEIVEKLARLKDLLTPAEYELLYLHDGLGLQYCEIHIRNHWNQTVDVFENNPGELRILENALLKEMRFQRDKAYTSIRDKALAGLAQRGFPFNSKIESNFSDRYKKARDNARRVAARLFDEDS